VFGYTAAEVIGKSITIIIPQDRLDEEPRILRRIRSGERVDHFETIRRRKDGTLLDISLTISPVRDTAGNIIGASKIARDISERRRNERAIEALNAQLTADLAAMGRMQQLSTRLIHSGDVHKLLLEVVDAAVEVTGADMGNIQLFENDRLQIVAERGYDAGSMDFFNSVGEGDTACGRALRRGERVIVDDVARSPVFAGTPALPAMLAAGAMAVQSTPLVSRSGQTVGVLSTHYRTPHRPGDREVHLIDILARQAADVIERRRAETELLASESRFRQLADSMPQIVWTARPEGHIDYFNERWYEYTGFGHDEPGDASWQRILHPDDVRRASEAWAMSVSTAEPFQQELRFWDRQEKRWRWFIGRALAVRDSSGAVSKWFGTSTDIDAQKHVQDELRRANKDLEQFAFSASHDLQEPLRSIRIYGDLLHKRYSHKLDGQAFEFLEYLRDAATRMQELVRDLLEYTQVARVEAPTEHASAEHALSIALANLTAAVAETGATISREPMPSVPVHETHLRQLFQNLIGNALKYRHAARPPAVHIGAEQRGGLWILSVRDNGIGIAPQYKEHIFGLFKRLHTEDEYSGTGIGLAICQRIVERYQGRIWVESQPGEGSTFFVALPA